MKTAVDVAVLMTCHERMDTTLGSLRCLFGSDRAGIGSLHVYLVDAGSDGTAEEAELLFPDVRALKVDSSVHWCSGMRRAWDAAREQGYDFYLWLNDDTEIVPTALMTALGVASTHPFAGPVVVAGSTRDPETDDCTYGGFRSDGQPQFHLLERVQPSHRLTLCTSMNGNFVLVPNAACDRVGVIDSCFNHGMGDLDYGFRLTRAGIPIVLFPGYVGTCAPNDMQRWASPDEPIATRLRLLLEPRGLPPREWLVFTKRHGGWFWFVRFLSPYIRVVVPSAWIQTRRLRDWVGTRYRLFHRDPVDAQ